MGSLFVRLALLTGMALLAGCSGKVAPPPSPGLGPAVCWDNLRGWNTDNLIEAKQALEYQCPRLAKKSEHWKTACDALASGQIDTNNALSALLKQHFQPHTLIGLQGKNEGLITGYYEPTLRGSFSRDATYHYPLYKRPEQMLTIDFGDRLPELKKQRLRGRIENNRVVPFYSRQEIDSTKQPLKGEELLWIDDPNAAFFLHIQGSGRVELPDGSLVGVGYADQNGQPYYAIGKALVKRGHIDVADISLQSIRAWLESNPAKANEIKNLNPSYIFFTLRHDMENGPRGSLNVPLTPERSIAVDRSIIPLGTPVWVDTELPKSKQPYQRLMIAQDTGGAIRGPVRADVFFGRGERAEQLAGHMKQRGQLYALIPKQITNNTADLSCN